MPDTKPLLMLTTGETALVITSTGIKGTITVPHPMTVIQIGFIVTTAPTVTVPVIAFDRRISPGSDTGKIDADLGSITKALASLPIGAVLKADVCRRVDKGDQIAVRVVTASTAGAGIAYVLGYAAGEGAVEYSTAAIPLVITVDSD